MSHMKTGTSGSVTSMIRADSQSITATAAMTTNGTTEASTTWGRYRAKYPSSPSTPWTATAASSDPLVPSVAIGCDRRRFSTTASRSSERTLQAARCPAIAIPAPSAPRTANATTSSTRLAPETLWRGAVKPARHDPRQQDCLEHDRDRAGEPQRGVDRQQRSRRRGAPEQARVEGAHPGYPDEVGGVPTRRRNTWNDQPWYSMTTGRMSTATTVITTSE